MEHLILRFRLYRFGLHWYQLVVLLLDGFVGVPPQQGIYPLLHNLGNGQPLLQEFLIHIVLFIISSNYQNYLSNVIDKLQR
ncbi:hypothetical protein M3226_22870 [Neobacillus cucumis]|uniref:hypothetical protein n=1 Tax=Neobacillus cucumis TaxID=1740721 RepID=UPI00203AE64C|nr:hypothetical protein [Neobacillus cucumis]MCM3728496.1 hypothetical protein [Neobacillus cucumis]